MSDIAWYWARGQERIGPISFEALIIQLSAQGPGQAEQTLVFGPGLSAWAPAAQVPAIMSALAAARQQQGSGGSFTGGFAPPPPVPTNHPADPIAYEIVGHDMQYAIVRLEPGQTAIADAGSMVFMTSGIQMQTVL